MTYEQRFNRSKIQLRSEHSKIKTKNTQVSFTEVNIEEFHMT